MDKKDGHPILFARSAVEWRNWLLENAEKNPSIWLVIYHKGSKKQSITYSEAVDEALCFGWIDSKPNKRDSESYFQFFSKRNPQSNWSRVNKDKVVALEKANKLTPSGLEMIRIAKENGKWDALDDVENLIIPKDLKAAFQRYHDSESNWEAFPKSVKRGILEWILNAKKAETRSKRIEETASKAQFNVRANQWR